jgi:hypothetical protein
MALRISDWLMTVGIGRRARSLAKHLRRERHPALQGFLQTASVVIVAHPPIMRSASP